MDSAQLRAIARLRRLQFFRWRRAVSVTCMLLLCGAAVNVRSTQPTAETAESSVESVVEQALTPGPPSHLLVPPPAKPYTWAHGSVDRRHESPDLDVPERPPEFA